MGSTLSPALANAFLERISYKTNHLISSVISTAAY